MTDPKPTPSQLHADPEMVATWQRRLENVDRQIKLKPNDPSIWQWQIRRKILKHLLACNSPGEARFPDVAQPIDPVVGSLGRSESLTDSPNKTIERAAGVETGADSQNPPRDARDMSGTLSRIRCVVRQARSQSRQERLAEEQGLLSRAANEPVTHLIRSLMARSDDSIDGTCPSDQELIELTEFIRQHPEIDVEKSVDALG